MGIAICSFVMKRLWLGLRLWKSSNQTRFNSALLLATFKLSVLIFDMGVGSYFLLINAAPWPFYFVKQHSYQMSTWDFTVASVVDTGQTPSLFMALFKMRS